MKDIIKIRITSVGEPGYIVLNKKREVLGFIFKDIDKPKAERWRLESSWTYDDETGDFAPTLKESIKNLLEIPMLDVPVKY